MAPCICEITKQINKQGYTGHTEQYKASKMRNEESEESALNTADILRDLCVSECVCVLMSVILLELSRFYRVTHRAESYLASPESFFLQHFRTADSRACVQR